MSESWVYLFSRFTPEALLFEVLAIFVLGGVYSGYWILKKRKIGANGDEAIPAGVVKAYLNELIVDAEAMRAQLFGLLQGAQAGTLVPGQAQATLASLQLAAGSGTMDPALLAKIKELELRMAEQSKSMDAIVIEKEKLLAELAALRLAQQSGASAAAAPGAPATAAHDDSELKMKIAHLEAKLAEYSIIEDDLANLKRLQQENAQLKAALAGAGKAVPTAADAPAASASEPAPSAAAQAAASAAVAQTSATPAPAAVAASAVAAAAAAPATPAIPEQADAVAELEAAVAAESSAPAPAAAAPAPAAPAAPAAEPENFDKLVDEVERSLQPDPADAAAPAAAAAAEKPAAPAAAMDKSDADLVEEFEKMLSG